MEIRNTVAVVTGGTGALGKRICKALAVHGTNVVVVYQHSRQEALSFSFELEKEGVRSIALQADVTKEADVKGMVEKTLQAFGRIDILVNDAAYNTWVSFPDLSGLTLEIWEKIMGVNTTGPFLCMREAGPVMKRQGNGRIVNISSIAGLEAGGSSIAYAVSKAALIHLTRCMAIALAPQVLVNCIAPGFMEGTRSTANLDISRIERAKKSVLTGRAVDKDDIAAQVITFIRSESTTGQTVLIDGGRFFH